MDFGGTLKEAQNTGNGKRAAAAEEMETRDEHKSNKNETEFHYEDREEPIKPTPATDMKVFINNAVFDI
jgi:hypothetical protein